MEAMVMTKRKPTASDATVMSKPFSRGTAGGESPYQLHIRIIEPGKRKPVGYRRDFPTVAVLLMWGLHDIPLTDLPPLTSRLRWHCANFGACWQEMARRCHASGHVWLDTVSAAIENRKPVAPLPRISTTSAPRRVSGKGR